ncbi:neuralized-like protein 4 isoform X1 [Littorina saxatilis]|uniref:neuralized-like protein 4 isoform X1 n=1 Tax=Littorina saxatilis TaxID=31220 RepID=UPI0038B67ADC
MATAAVTTVAPSDMECTVCHEHFTLPRILPCGHLLCRDCLVTWLNAQPEANCPLCRCEIVDPKQHKGKSFEDIADGFPCDFAMAALVEADRVLSKQHECCVCVDKAAVDVCINCSDMFCQMCSTLHKKQSATKHHTIESLSSLTAETLAAKRPATCQVHDDRVSEVYCPTHGASVCWLCASTSHRQCPDVTNLETKMVEARKLMSELADILTKGEAELEQAIAGLDKDLQEIDKRTQATVAEVEAACDRLEKSVKECRHRLRELALSTSCDVKDNMIQVKTIFVQRKGKVTTHRVIVQRAEGFPTLGSLGKMASQMGTRVHGLDLTSTLPSDVKDIPMVTFDAQAVSRIVQELSTLRLVQVQDLPILRFHDNHGQKIRLSNDNQTAQRTSSDIWYGIVMSRDPMLAGMLYQDLPTLRFHDNHGQTIRLSNNNQTAQRTSNFGGGIVMSRDPMLAGMLYQVQINEVNNIHRDTYLGVVTKSPDTFTLPYTFILADIFADPHPAALCVTPVCVRIFGDTKEEERSVLDKLAVGSKVGLAVDTDRSLHLYVDGKHQGVVAPDIPTPCYFMFDMFAYCTKGANKAITMATAAVTTVAPSDMECTVCHEHFTLPRILPCGHLLCRDCLVTWLNAQPEANCPLCRCEIVDPKQHKGKSYEDIADGFPCDFAMAALVEADRVLSKQHECCVCVDKAAVDVCINCSDMFCQMCSTLHKKQSVSKRHTIESLSSLTAETLAAKRPATCQVHDDEVSKLYCPTHGVSICLFCATADHRQCPDVTKLESKMAEARSALADLAAILSRGERELAEAIAGLDKDILEIDKRTQAIVAEVEAACDRLEKSVKECRHRLRELALSTSCDVKDKVIQVKTIFVQRKGKVTTHRVIVQRAEGFPTLGSLGKMASQMGTRVHDLDLTSTLPPDVKDISMLTVDAQAVSRIVQELSTLRLDLPTLRFHDNHGQKIRLSNDNQTAQKTSGFQDGIVMSRDPMLTGMLYQVQINEVNNSYSGTCLGVVTKSPATFILPLTFLYPHPAALCVTPVKVSIFGDTKGERRSVLDKLAAGSKVGLAVDTDRSLHLYVDGKHQGVVAPDIPTPCYFMFELIFRCTKVTALPVTSVP